MATSICHDHRVGVIAAATRCHDHLGPRLAPARLRRHRVERTSAIRYGPDRATHLLDLYRARDLKAAKGFVIHFHGGGFFSGRRSKEARLLMEQLATAGWIGISADYRLEPAAFPDQVVDAKRVLAWTREHARDYGADPETVVLVGGSAGAHIATICALTAGDPRFQPGVRDADTRVSAIIGLYGYYGPAPTRGLPSAPEDYLSEATGKTSPDGIPPTMIVHGDRDPMVAPAMARRMAEQLRDASADQVVYVELPGGTTPWTGSIRYAAQP
jgi:acetyl esterase/lipase